MTFTLALTGLVLAAAAAPARFVLDASVDADLRTVRGTLTYEACACAFVDPLASLPAPDDDRTSIRTFPHGPSTGAVTFDVLPALPDTLRFVARLPERFGEVGSVDGWGLRGLGGWYPQPVDGAGVPVAGEWQVSVRLAGAPDTVVLNDVVSEGSARWAGETDRVALAVVPDAVVTALEVDGRRITLVERRRPERYVHRWITELGAGWTLPARDLVVVEGMDLRRLVHAGSGVVFLSDRAFRLERLVARYHAAPVRTAMVTASVPRAAGWERTLVAEALVADLPVPSVQKLLGWLSWNPVIDAVLHDGTLPYYPEVFDEAFPDPEDLLDRIGGRIPARAAARQLVDGVGPDVLRGLVEGLLAGEELDVAAAAVPEAIRAGWSRAYPAEQNYRVVVAPRQPPTVVRDAPAGAPAEVVVVKVDGEALPPWTAGPGPDALVLDGKPRTVSVDAAGHTLQSDRVDDRWPARWSVIFSGGVYDISPTQHNFALDGLIALRRHGDTRNLFLGGLSHDSQDIVGLWLQYVRYVGPLLDRQLRQHRLVVSGGPSLLDPAFRPTTSGAVAIGAGASYAWDTRQGDVAMSGHRLSLGVGGGFIPGSPEVWASAGLAGVKLLALSDRSVVALRGRAGWASGDVEHRLLALGGADQLRSVVDHEAVGNERLLANVELRQAVFRYASIPLPLAWLEEIQLSPGIEGGVLWRDGGERYAGIGATLGARTIIDALGARPVLAGVSVAVPLWEDGFTRGGPQVYFDFTQSF